MADNVVFATGNVYLHVNDDSATNSANEFAVHKWSTGSVLFRVLEGGEVFEIGEIRRANPLVFQNTDTSASIIARFRMESMTRLELQYTSSQAVFITTATSPETSLELTGNPGVYLILDADADSSPNYVRIRNGGGSDRWVMGDDKSMTWYNSASAVQAEYTAGSGNVVLTLGSNASVQGYLKVHAQTTGTARAALLELDGEGTIQGFLWVDASGVLRIHTSDPGADDTLGVSVGSQS